VSTEAKRSDVVPAEDEAGFKRGRGRMLVGLGLAGLLAVTGLWLLLSRGDEARVYGELGRKINGLRAAHFDQFWACALPGEDLHDLKSNADLTAQLDDRAANGGMAYAHYLREACEPQLSDINSSLDVLIIPADLAPDVENLKSSTSQLRSALLAFVAIFESPSVHYDSQAAKPRLDSIARGWFDFQKAHASINRTLKARLSGAD
jgi:hypothetical protein